MAYKIVMPQLSDSMQDGKLISWKVKEGDFIKKGDTIAEVESDKAVMEVQSFQEGTVTKLDIHEGESVPVGTVIAEIDSVKSSKLKTATKELNSSLSNDTIKDNNPLTTKEILKPQPLPIKKYFSSKSDASPKARALATKYELNIDTLQQQKKLPVPAHETDIQNYYLQRFFTQKALEVLKKYKLDPLLFSQKKKLDSNDIQEYVKTHNIPLSKPIGAFEKALILSVEHAAKKPVFHIYDFIDTKELFKHKQYTITVWLLSIFAKTMIEHDSFRTILQNDNLITYPNSSISLAVARKKQLYMPVFHNVNLLCAAEINKQLKKFEQKAKIGRMQKNDMTGSTFGISNLGMLGISSFDAMINKNDAGIAAIGAQKQGKMSITLTLDHRIINGYQAAQFMQCLKEQILDPNNYKE